MGRVIAAVLGTLVTLAVAAGGSVGSITSASALRVREYSVPAGSHPHDVAPASDGTVWYTAQGAGKLGRLDPGSGKTT